MAMNCCHKEYAKVCEILVCVDALAPHNPGLYERLRFGLLASSWLPSPLGILLWRALHVMFLIINGPAFWVLGLLTAFLCFSVLTFGCMGIGLCITYVALGLISVPVDLVLLLVQSITFCWSSPAPLDNWFNWRRGACLTVLVWKNCKTVMTQMFSTFVPMGVPCMSGSLYKETKNQKLETWARWYEEVVHRHETIAL